jgi:WD40 repeat protein
VHVLNGHSSDVNSLCYSPDGKTLASGSRDETVRIWDVMSGECVSTESSLPVSSRSSSTPLPYDGSGDVCVDVFSCSEVSVTYSSSTFYNNIVLVHRMNM